jgi:DNA-binding transcriptional MerR regulator
MNEYFMPISELSKKLDIPAHTLRYWEREFPALIQPTTGAGGRRFYRAATVDNVAALKRYLYADGYTIDGVKKLVASGGFAAAKDAKVGDSAPPPEAAELVPHRQADLSGVEKAIGLLKEARALLGDD